MTISVPADTARVIVERNVTVDGYDAEHWRESYLMLRDAVVENLDAFAFDDDVAEEAIVCKAIEDVGAAIQMTTEWREYEATGGKDELGGFLRWLRERSATAGLPPKSDTE